MTVSVFTATRPVETGADGDALLASNDDHGDSAASRIYWEATSSDRYFLEVASFGARGEGSYTLTVIVR